MKYPTKTIRKAITLREAGVPFRVIAKRLGIKSEATVRFHTSPTCRKDQARRLKALREKWKKNNGKK
jgi:transposase-like protein